MRPSTDEQPPVSHNVIPRRTQSLARAVFTCAALLGAIATAAYVTQDFVANRYVEVRTLVPYRDLSVFPMAYTLRMPSFQFLFLGASLTAPGEVGPTFIDPVTLIISSDKGTGPIKEAECVLEHYGIYPCDRATQKWWVRFIDVLDYVAGDTLHVSGFERVYVRDEDVAACRTRGRSHCFLVYVDYTNTALVPDLNPGDGTELTFALRAARNAPVLVQAMRIRILVNSWRQDVHDATMMPAPEAGALTLDACDDVIYLAAFRCATSLVHLHAIYSVAVLRDPSLAFVSGGPDLQLVPRMSGESIGYSCADPVDATGTPFAIVSLALPLSIVQIQQVEHISVSAFLTSLVSLPASVLSIFGVGYALYLFAAKVHAEKWKSWTSRHNIFSSLRSLCGRCWRGCYGVVCRRWKKRQCRQSQTQSASHSVQDDTEASRRPLLQAGVGDTSTNHLSRAV
eukprot:Opistho-2@70440